jgi:topoisomerase IA-like protein
MVRGTQGKTPTTGFQIINKNIRYGKNINPDTRKNVESPLCRSWVI